MSLTPLTRQKKRKTSLGNIGDEVRRCLFPSGNNNNVNKRIKLSYFQQHCSYEPITTLEILRKELISNVNDIMSDIKHQYYIENNIIEFIMTNYKKGHNISVNNNMILFNPFVIHHFMNNYQNMIIIGVINIGMGHMISLCIDRNTGKLFYTNDGGYDRKELELTYLKNTVMSATLCNPKYVYTQKDFLNFIINNPFVKNGYINFENISELINY